MFRRRQSGFSIVAAIFIIVVLAALAAALVTVATLQHSGTGLDLQGVRAYEAARAGTEWGLYRVLDPDGAASPSLPTCWAGSASVTPGGSLSGFSVSATCTQTTTTELNRDIGVYTVVATASFGVANQPNYVARVVTATVSRCKDPANPPDFSC
jgi:MSHA biogenesis protein MshP